MDSPKIGSGHFRQENWGMLTYVRWSVIVSLNQLPVAFALAPKICKLAICDDIYFTWAMWLVGTTCQYAHMIMPQFYQWACPDPLAHYEQSHSYDQTLHALSNIHGLYGCSCNFLDIISIYSLSLGKLPGCFSYKRPAIFSRRSYK